MDRRTFPGETQAELLERITTQEPRPPRQIDDKVPRELERICLKALAKRTSERYTTALDMAEDLRHFLETYQGVARPESSKGVGRSTPFEDSGGATQPRSAAAHPRAASVDAKTSMVDSDSGLIKIVPKGLRAFDENDANVFVELLPGPRDREGFPDSLRFWKTRIEEVDADKTFCVGLIYGPSGCGKSSLVQAGLLPRLSEDVTAVYIEATPKGTEARLLGGLRKRCPGLPADLDLKQTLAALRRGQGIPAGKKVLIVLDQFEQWLHANKEVENAELVQALRQCEGSRVQCIVMVRDDFWLAVSRIMLDLEVDLVPGRNVALVDLFDLDHARKLLAAFGRAFGRLPENRAETSKEQKNFLKQAVNSLAEEGKVVCVRLALFAEMMKSKPWTPAALNEGGGTKGIGVIFLEETFSVQTANPKHHRHQEAARSVLKALLPESDANIKGRMRSYTELLEVSGYAGRTQDFDELLRILDNEVRLITPTELDGVAGGEWRVAGNTEGVAGENSDDRATLPAVGGVAVGHGAGGELLSGDQGLPKGGAIWTDKSNPTVGGVDPGKHCRGTGEGAHQGIPEPSEHRPRIADGGGNALDVEPAGRVAETGGTGGPVGADRSHQPDAQRPTQSPGKTPLGTAGLELRMAGEDSSVPTTRHSSLVTRHYQLTHDYLVSPLREWLTRKQKETRRGRAELRLAERSAAWHAKPDNRHLPSVWEWGTIWALTDNKTWTGPQRRMMRKAGRVHVARWASGLLVVLGIAILIQQMMAGTSRRHLTERTQTAVQAMKNSRGVFVPRAIEDVQQFPRELVLEELRARFADS